MQLTDNIHKLVLRRAVFIQFNTPESTQYQCITSLTNRIIKESPEAHIKNNDELYNKNL